MKSADSKAFDNVWEALADSPEEATCLSLRSDIMSALADVVGGWTLPRREVAHRLGITQPRLNDLLRGRINKFSLEALLALAVRAGLDVRMDVRPARAA